MSTLFLEYLDKLTAPFLNPQNRVFFGYLISAFLIATAVTMISRNKSLGQTLKELFSVRIWGSRSAWADYKIIIINQAVMMGTAPRLISKLAIATLLFESLHIWFDGRVLLWPDAPGWVIAGLFTLVLFLLDDSSKYLLHRMLHRWPVLWCFHQVHHSAETLTPLTVYRTHPVEGVIFALRAILVQAAAVSAFMFFFGGRVELMSVLGANVFLFTFNIAGSNLRHSHVWLSYGPIIERIFISPAQHQIHHSVDNRHRDRNFGAVLAIWDWLGGSLFITGKEKKLTFGPGAAKRSSHQLITLYLFPFIEATKLIASPFTKGHLGMPGIATRKPKTRFTFLCLIISVFMMGQVSTASARELNIYSHRQPFLIQPFLDAYERKTGTKINVVYASKGLAQRLQAEGSRSPADVILTVDISRLNVYADKNLLAPVESEVLDANVPAHLRAADKRWFAFSKRARVIAVSNQVDDVAAIKRYEDLADPKWKGRICSRPGSHVYNRALIASLVHAAGTENAQAWAQGVMDNLARRPQGNDRAQVKAIFEGVCDIAIINSYYFGKLKHSDKPEHRDWAAAVDLIFPNQNDRGAHVNISGGGVAIHSKNKEEAVRFMEFLTSGVAQGLYGDINYEYPVNPKIEASDELKSWGTFMEDQMPISRIAELAPEAQKIIDRVGW